MPASTTVPSEGFVDARENLKIFIIIYRMIIDDGKERSDFRSTNGISVQYRGVLNV
jgi:hypothetical protein